MCIPTEQKAELQKRKVEDLLARGVKGITISPTDPRNQTGWLDEIAARTVLITHDSDAPKSRRLCFVGMDNYAAGRTCGELVREAMPDGGTVAMFVGSIDAENGRQRRQGVIDVLLERPADPDRFDAQEGELKGTKYTVVGTFTDGSDRPKGKANAQDALTRWPQLGCLVGLYEYNAPLILEAVRSAKAVGKVQIVGFDENALTLKGVAEGQIHGTVVQDPFNYGYQSIKLLASLARAPDAAARQALLPKNGFLDIPVRAIRRANVAAFEQELAEKLGKPKSGK
jgi:ribose transport system substrate-binding protein